jgi:pyruvate formate lyase activating enzyme
MKEALLWKKDEDNKVKCHLCSHRCLIADGGRGVCMVRENQKGMLYSLVYGKLIATNVDPVEKKPVYHFYPGHRSYSIASVGCNFRCSFCQNWDISQMPRDHKGIITGRDFTPENVVAEAIQNNCLSISYTYTEPTVWYEFTKDCGELARAKGLKNIYVSNGFMTREMIDDATFLDVARIDLKSFSDDFYRKVCGGRLEPVLDNLKYFKKKGIWIEVVTLIVPEQNDSDEELTSIAEFIADELGDETPWHISAFHPDYKMQDSYPTPDETLVKAYSIGKDAGLDYVYVGNSDVHTGKDTRCPQCKEVLIKRKWFSITDNVVKEGKCPKCGHKIAGYF